MNSYFTLLFLSVLYKKFNFLIYINLSIKFTIKNYNVHLIFYIINQFNVLLIISRF